MASLTEIESAIYQLPSSEIRKLADRLQAYLEDQWDEQIAADAAPGKLDDLIAQAESDIEAGHVKPLDEIIDNA